MELFIKPITLIGKHVRLEPLDVTHTDDLIKAATDGGLWNLWYTSVPLPEKMGEYIDKALYARKHFQEMPFVVCKNLDGKPGEVIGTTRMCRVDSDNRRLEVGFTWYARSVQRTVVNTECKYLMLSHAFEQLKCIAVEFRTHWLNQQSRAAITRLGAKQDGIIRNHQIMPNGTYRDTVIFSIIESEWPTVKINLASKLNFTG